jgi:peptide-methionine (S)-S-oxide reductase
MAWVVWSRNTATLLLGLSGFLPLAHAKQLEQAIFAGGCFWCMEEAFEKIRGVKSVDSGYTGGRTASPTYEPRQHRPC